MASIALFCGCATPPDENAVRQAVAQCNEEAKRLYHIAPFTAENGKLRTEGHHWVWDALTSSEGHDLVAIVTFDSNGSVLSAFVRMQDSRVEPSKETPGVVPN